jgi:hypothetical protein
MDPPQDQYAHNVRKVLQNLPMRMSKPVAVLLAIYRRRGKQQAKEATIWLHKVHGDEVTGVSGKEVRADLFDEEVDEDLIDDPMAGSDGNGHREALEIVIEDPVSTGMPRTYLDGLSEIEFSVSSLVYGRNLVTVRWQVDGKHTGTLFGEPASGRQVTVAGVTLFKFTQSEGPDEQAIFTATEDWSCWDLVAVLEQLRGTQ